jgi:hypothetical protein
MRVPDLDWPADLFKDVIGVLPEATVALYAAAPMRPTLWADLAKAWMGNDARPEGMFNSGQVAAY